MVNAGIITVTGRKVKVLCFVPTPQAVVTAFIARGFMAYYKVSGEARVKELIKSACEFVKTNIHCTLLENSRCYSCMPVQKDIVVNANLLAAEIFAYDTFFQVKKAHQRDKGSAHLYTLNPKVRWLLALWTPSYYKIIKRDV